MTYQTTIEQFYQYLAQKNIATWMTLWASEASTHFPYANDLLPSELPDRAAIKEFWSGAPDLYEQLSFQVEAIFEKEQEAVVFFSCKNLIKDSQTYYQDQQVGRFTFDEAGNITAYQEYFDSLNLGKTFGMIAVQNLEG